jgi:hypothetical protein
MTKELTCNRVYLKRPDEDAGTKRSGGNPC